MLRKDDCSPAIFNVCGLTQRRVTKVFSQHFVCIWYSCKEAPTERRIVQQHRGGTPCAEAKKCYHRQEKVTDIAVVSRVWGHCSEWTKVVPILVVLESGGDLSCRVHISPSIVYRFFGPRYKFDYRPLGSARVARSESFWTTSVTILIHYCVLMETSYIQLGAFSLHVAD